MKKYTKIIGEEVIWFLKSHYGESVEEAKLIGSLAKKGYSNNDIDIYIPRIFPKGGVSEKQFIEDLKIKLEAKSVIETDWGGYYFKDTHYGDVDIFFDISKFDF